MKNINNTLNWSIRPKRWGIKRCHLVIGTGPFVTRKRLMGTQWGLIYRDNRGSVLLAYARTRSEVSLMMVNICTRTLPIYHACLKITKHESAIHPSDHLTPGATKHKRIFTRRQGKAQAHLKWWQKSAGFAANLNPPGVDTYVHIDGRCLNIRVEDVYPLNPTIGFR